VFAGQQSSGEHYESNTVDFTFTALNRWRTLRGSDT